MKSDRPSQFWRGLVWKLLFPRRADRAEATLSGMMLIALSLGVGLAAYNSANNILFITLSLLLASLILSGVLSWLNMRGVEVELRLDSPYREGVPASVEVIVRNRKRLLPSYGLWFDLVAEPMADLASLEPEPAKAKRDRRSIRARLAAADQRRSQGRLSLGEGLGAGEERRLVWNLTPSQRGRWRVELEGLGSLFPFGFLRKQTVLAEEAEVLVWPALVKYERYREPSYLSANAGERAKRSGGGDDLFALRRYEPGDSHRLIHWKASARQRQLLVRQFSAETDEAHSLRFDADRELWSSPEAFETAVKLAATMAEDLFREGKLRALGSDELPLTRVRRGGDVESWLDRMATVTPRKSEAVKPAEMLRLNRIIITFRPDGPKGAAAYVNGRKITSA